MRRGSAPPSRRDGIAPRLAIGAISGKAAAGVSLDLSPARLYVRGATTPSTGVSILGMGARARTGTSAGRPGVSSVAQRPARAPRLRGMTLLPAGVFAVHQLRLMLEFGDDGAHAAEGHVYVGSLLAWVTIAVAAGLGGLIAHLARGLRGGGTVAGPRLVRLWAATSAALVGLHVLHEALEGLLLGGPGLAGLVGIGGLCALAAAVLVGGVIALALRGARSLIVAIVRRRGIRPGHPVADARMPAPRSAARRLLAPLSRSAAGRAPPARPRLAA
jgi:hypothetical protein